MANFRLTDAATAIEDWSSLKMDRLIGLADEIIDEFNLTLNDLNTIRGFQCIGTDDDKEIMEFIEMELEERLDNENQTQYS
jgi:hypothetical protein